MEEKTILLPLYAALIDQADHFSEEELLELICEKKTLSGIDCAFVEIYCNNQYDPDKMAALLDDKRIADEVKEYIASHCAFSAQQLCELFRQYDSRVAVVAIKRLAVTAPEVLTGLVDEAIAYTDDAASDEKNRALCLAMAGAYEGATDKEEADVIREAFAPILKRIYEQSSSQLAQNEAIYALGRICDDELFSWIMDNDSIDKYVKISVIMRNSRQLKALAESAASEDDLSSLIKAMHLLPMIEIGTALQSAVDSGSLASSEELISLIAYIEKNGIPAVDKYD